MYICIHRYIHIVVVVVVVVVVEAEEVGVVVLYWVVSWVLFLSATRLVQGSDRSTPYCRQRVKPPSVESRIGPKGDFGLTPGGLWTLSKPDPYPKSVLIPAHKVRNVPNLWNPFGGFDGLTAGARRLVVPQSHKTI